RSVAVGRLESGKRQRGDVVAIGSEQARDLVPGPRPEPEAWNEDDRCAVHGPMLAAPARRRPRRHVAPRGRYVAPISRLLVENLVGLPVDLPLVRLREIALLHLL